MLAAAIGAAALGQLVDRITAPTSPPGTYASAQDQAQAPAGATATKHGPHQALAHGMQSMLLAMQEAR